MADELTDAEREYLREMMRELPRAGRSMGQDGEHD